MRDVPGVARAFIDRPGELPQMQIEIDRAHAARYGLNVADIQDVIETALGGKEATADLGRRAQVRAWWCGCARSERDARPRCASILDRRRPRRIRIPLDEVASFRTSAAA